MPDETLTLTQFEKQTDTELLAGMVNILRPRRLKFAHQSSTKLEQLTDWLQAHPKERYRLRKAITDTIGAAYMQYIFSESGLLTSSGFFAELQQKTGS